MNAILFGLGALSVAYPLFATIKQFGTDPDAVYRWMASLTLQQMLAINAFVISGLIFIGVSAAWTF